MTAKMSVSSLTQTWQVGPSRPVSANTVFIDAAESTDSIVLPRFTLSYYTLEGRLFRTLDLNLGSHSFFVPQNGEALAYRRGKYPGAAFEINVHCGGAFYVDISDERLARINGRYFSWMRLRAGDEIRYGSQRLLFEHCPSSAMEKTIAGSNKEDAIIAPSQPKEVEARSPSPSHRLKWIAVLFVSVLMLALAAFTGYKMAKAQREKGQNTPPEMSLNRLLPGSTERESKGLASSPSVLTREDFEDTVALFREGKSEEACVKFRKASSTPFTKNLWSEKAYLFVKRRCR